MFATAAALATTGRDARACGGCFHEQGPTQNGTVITDHRMIFRVSPQETTLYDEIQYSGSPTSFAWVLPIHGPVTVGLSSDVLFASVDQATQTTIVAPTLPPCPSNNCFCGEFGGEDAGFAAPDAYTAPGVTIIGQQTVGPYDTVQLQSSDPNALTSWLTANGYNIPSDVAKIIAAYVTEGFDFLALRLSPGQGVQSMRPVRVTSPGAGLSLPLRMVAAGTGATVGITLWVVADGRYESQNFPSFVISPSVLVWDWSQASSNYTTERANEEALRNDAAWQIESSLDVSPYQIENPVLDGPNDYLPVAGAAADAGDGGGVSAGETADQVRQDDLSTLFPPGNLSTVRITRMRGDLSHAALANDLVLQASADISALSNVYQVTQSVNAPVCPPVQACPPCPNPPGNNPGSPYGGDTGGMFGGGSGSIFGSSSGSTSHAGSGGGCSSTASEPGGSGPLLAVLGLVGVALVRSVQGAQGAQGKRRRPRRRA
jgi:MYXO-CTERM domain-containing protein